MLSNRWAVAALLGLALLVRLYVAWRPVPFLLRLNLPDDAYYYFLIAHHIGTGDGPSFDGLTINNGFHPLWLLVTLPLFAGEELGADLPVHLALSLGALLDAATCYILYRVATRLAGRAAGRVAGLFYALNVMSVLQATNGLETPLGGMLAAAAWWGVLALAERPTARRAVGWGGLVGLMLLARTDYVLLAVPLGLYLLARRRDRAGWVAAFLAVAACGLVLLPWLAWNRVHFGSFMQVSGVAVPYASHQRYAMGSGGELWGWIRQSLGHLLEPAGWLRGDFVGGPPFAGLLWWGLVVVAVGRCWRRGDRGWLGGWLPMVAAAAGLVLVHTLIRWYPRPWYFMASAQALAVGLGAGLVGLWKAAEGWGRRTLAAVLSGLVVVSLVGWAYTWRIGLYPWQDRMLEAAGWIERNVPPGELVGSLNAGIYAYYSDRTVVNLDGVVNPEAFAAIRERRLLAYMVERGIGYFVDFDHALEKEYGVFMGPGYPEGLVYIADAAPAPYPILGTIRAYRVEVP